MPTNRGGNAHTAPGVSGATGTSPRVLGFGATRKALPWPLHPHFGQRERVTVLPKHQLSPASTHTQHGAGRPSLCLALGARPLPPCGP